MHTVLYITLAVLLPGACGRPAQDTSQDSFPASQLQASAALVCDVTRDRAGAALGGER